ncbi:MAG TPA: hypothetical protein VFW09_10160 [Solirubrobacteraceae bacterium]|nr:hypothetical protein [Solirubrobacteraceae bacterium]
MRPAIRYATIAVHALRHLLPDDAGLAAGAASAGDPGPLLEHDVLAEPIAPRR